MPIPLARLNRLDRPAFAAVLGGVFERSPWIPERAWSRRPFSTIDDLHAALCAVVEAASVEEKLALVRAHPELAAKRERAADLAAESRREQAAAGLDELETAQGAELARLNRAYREKFGFPFVICARENPSGSILRALAARLDNSPEAELAAALEQIGRIAYFRLLDAVDEAGDL